MCVRLAGVVSLGVLGVLCNGNCAISCATGSGSLGPVCFRVLFFSTLWWRATTSLSLSLSLCVCVCVCVCACVCSIPNEAPSHSPVPCSPHTVVVHTYPSGTIAHPGPQKDTVQGTVHYVIKQGSSISAPEAKGRGRVQLEFPGPFCHRLRHRRLTAASGASPYRPTV